MTKLLLVEDEFLVRLGLKTFIPWEEFGFELIGEAVDGLDALTILAEKPCDLLITDISMPNMDGISLMERVKELYPHIKILILSNYNDFGYVRRALQLGASDYILKLTMQPDDLQTKLQQMQKEIENERKKQEEMLLLNRTTVQFRQEITIDKHLRDLLTMQYSKKEADDLSEEYANLLPPFPWTVSMMKIDRYESVVDENRFKSEKLLRFSVMNILREIMRKYKAGHIVEMDGGRFGMISGMGAEPMLQEMTECIHRYLKLAVYFGTYAPVERAYDLHEACKFADEALLVRFYNDSSRVIHYREQMFANQALPISSQDEWLDMMARQDKEALQNAIRNMAEAYLEDGVPRPYPDLARERWLHIVHLFEVFLQHKGGDLYSIMPYEGKYPHHVVRLSESIQEISEWLIGWISVFFEHLRASAVHQPRPEIRAVQRMIEEKYSTSFKMSDLAKEVNFTEPYLSSLFKKETGETMIDYMIRIRMKKARELLKDANVKIYEVADAIGYSDPNYFAKLFKKIEGIYPQEYRKRYIH
ncbi:MULTISPECIES: response regulator [unclassified Paenibacillus]|uniref:response regulator n=1 Tax=unclassified Paenibacillus TaxID=185978 RepID=UPI00277DC611|nr:MULTISPECIES: response regulator [unclassified Paenibacillus]MDQ0901011.1 two-component system response regulator YesN [Paenibacillus sp. V4I7]MDQ0920488.1 two-component system response regulator YesN [Paenibacillus sp. V4I5]